MINALYVFVCCNEVWLICQGSLRIQATVQIWQRTVVIIIRKILNIAEQCKIKNKMLAREREGERKRRKWCSLINPCSFRRCDFVVVVVVVEKKVVFPPSCFVKTIDYKSNIWKKKRQFISEQLLLIDFIDYLNTSCHAKNYSFKCSVYNREREKKDDNCCSWIR